MESFDDYCERKGIQPGEEPAAFAAYLAENGAPDVHAVPICSCENDPDVCSVHGTREQRSNPNPIYFSDPRMGSFVLDEHGNPIAPARGCLIGILIGVAIWAIVVLILWKAGVW